MHYVLQYRSHHEMIYHRTISLFPSESPEYSNARMLSLHPQMNQNFSADIVHQCILPQNMEMFPDDI